MSSAKRTACGYGVKDLLEIVKKSKKDGKPLLLLVDRRGDLRYVAINFGKKKDGACAEWRKVAVICAAASDSTVIPLCEFFFIAVMGLVIKKVFFPRGSSFSTGRASSSPAAFNSSMPGSFFERGQIEMA
jgi:hypothetical protein